MKKLILFLLLPLWAMAQTTTGQEQEFDYGIKNNSTQTITTPPYLTTTGMDGTQGKIPSALIEKTDNKQNSLTIDGTGVKFPTVDAVNGGLSTKIGGTGTTNYLPKFTGIKILGDSNIYEGGIYPIEYAVGLSGNNVSQVSVKGNGGIIDANKSSFTIENTNGKPIAQFDNAGRLNLKDYVGNGAVSVLYNMAASPITENSYIGHYAFAGRNSEGQLQTTNILGSKFLSQNSISTNTELSFQFMRDQNTSGTYSQPNAEVKINKNGFFIPNIPIISTTGNQNFNSSITSDSFIKSYGSLYSLKDGNYSPSEGASLILGFASNANQTIIKNNLSNGLDLWNYDTVRGTFENTFTFDKNGFFKSRGLKLGNTDILENTSGPFSTILIKPLNANQILRIMPNGAGNLTALELYSDTSITRHVIENNNGILRIGADTSEQDINFISGNYTKFKIQSNGKIIIPDTPTTSSGTYDFVTRNTTTGVVEKVLSNTIAPIESPTFTGTPTAPTAAVGTTGNQIATLDYVQENVGANTYWTKTGSNIANNNAGIVTVAGMQFGNLGGNVFASFNRYGDDIAFILGNGQIGTGQPTEISIKNDTQGKLKSSSDLALASYGADKLIINSTKIKTYVPITLKNYTVATLPTGTQGDTAYVTDALAPTYMATVVGGGTVVCPVFYNGTAWVAH